MFGNVVHRDGFGDVYVYTICPTPLPFCTITRACLKNTSCGHSCVITAQEGYHWCGQLRIKQLHQLRWHHCGCHCSTSNRYCCIHLDISLCSFQSEGLRQAHNTTLCGRIICLTKCATHTV